MTEFYLHNRPIKPLAQSNGCSVYQLSNETGEGTITLYEVFPGVMVGYNDFHMQCYESDFVMKGDMFCIDHCREGRMEYMAGERSYSYVEAGDIKLDRRLTHTGHFEFPLSHYHGVMVSFDMAVAPEALKEEIKDFPVDLRKIQQKFCPDKYPRVIRGLSAVEHIFAELYAVPEKIKMQYFKIKALELLLFLEALEIEEEAEKRPYFYKTQVEKIRSIQNFLAEHMEQSFTQAELAKRFDISLTTMKNCFKSVYGISIGEWLLQYRMNQAAVMLRKNRNQTITEIAGKVGYESSSKFAAAFRKVMGMAPVEYRNQIWY